MCAKCDAAAANVPPEVLEGMAAQVRELVKLFKMTADMNFKGLDGSELFQVPVQVAAKALAESLYATFGQGRRKLSAELEAKVLPHYLEIARGFVQQEAAAEAAKTGGLH
jgi:hypothetical protein